MAIAHRASGAQASTSGTSHAVPYPAGMQANDLMVLYVTTKDEPITLPPSWTPVVHAGAVGQLSRLVAIKFATGSESGNLTVTTGDADARSRIVAYSGVDTTTPQDATAQAVAPGTAATSANLPSITTVTAGALVLYGVGVGEVTGTPNWTSSVSGNTERADFAGANPPAAGAFYDVPRPTAGATGTLNVSWGVSAAYWGFTMALRPAGGGGGSPQSITASPASEVDAATAVTLTSELSIAAGQASEVDAATATALSPGEISIAAGQASETDSATAVAFTSDLTVGVTQAAETETAQAISSQFGNTITIVPATETNSAEPVGVVIPQIIAAAQANESDQAQAINISIEQTIGVVQTAETDQALVVSSIFPFVAAIDTALEIDTASIVEIVVSVAPAPPSTVRRARPTPHQLYIFELADSETLSKLGELGEARDRSLQLALNKAGACNFWVPLDGEVVELMEEAKTCVLIRHRNREGNYETVWSGPIWTVREQARENRVDIGCVGWLQTLEKRVSKPEWATPYGPLTYTTTPGGAIALDLLQRTNDDAGAGEITYVTPGALQPTQERTRTYQPYVNILNEITELTQVENGFDMLVDPLTRELNIYTKLQEVQSNVIFEYGANTSNVIQSIDVSRLCNRMIAYSSVGEARAENLDSQAEYGLFEEAVSLSDVTDIEVLQAYADSEVAVRSYPLRLHDFEPRQGSSYREDEPRIFEDFDVGDIVYLRARKGRLEIPRQAVRLFGCTVQFSDTGREKVTSIQTTAS